MTYERLDLALRRAAELHRGQERDGDHPLPYLTHPVDVLTLLRHLGHVTDEDMLVAATLHDVVEESNADLGQLEKEFGARAAGLVRELTRREPTKEETRGMSKEEIWQLRSSMLLEEIARMSPEAQVVKLADRLSNVREAERTKLGDKLERYLGQTHLILQTVPRDRNPEIWDAIRSELERATSGAADFETAGL